MLFLLEVQTQDVVSINIWQILISLVNLLIIFLLLKKLLYEPVRKILADRQKQVTDVYDKANKAKSAAEAEKAEYDEKLSAAHKEAGEIVSSAKERASKLENEIVKEAENKAQNIKKEADAEIALERKKAMNEMKEDISSISVSLAEKVIGREINKDDHKAMIDDFISRIGEDDD